MSLATRPLYVTQPFSWLKSGDFNPSIVVHQANTINIYSNAGTLANVYRHNTTIDSHSFTLSSLSNPNLYPLYPISYNPIGSHPLNAHNNSNYCVHDQQYVKLCIKIKPNAFDKSTQAIASNKTKASNHATNIQINSKRLLTDSAIATQAAIVTSVASSTATPNHQSIYDHLLNNPSANLFTDSGISHFVQLCILTNVPDGNCNMLFWWFKRNTHILHTLISEANEHFLISIFEKERNTFKWTRGWIWTRRRLNENKKTIGISISYHSI